MQSLPGNTAPYQETTSFRPIMTAAFRYHRLWLMIVGGIIAASLLYALLAHREYHSEMDILVQNKRGDEQITPSRVNGEIAVSGVTEEEINSEIQLLLSRGLASQVVDPGWTSDSASKMTSAQLKAHDKAIATFEKHLSATMIRKSNVIQVTYIASSPKEATDTLNRLLTAFLAKQKEIAQPPGTSDFFTAQAASYKQQLDQARQQLATFQQQQQIVTLTDTEQTLDREIHDAQTDLRATDAQLSELAQQLDTETRQLRALPQRQMTQVRTVPNDYSIERLNTMLVELENKRTTLLTKFTENDRLVQEVNQQIADTKAALANAQTMTSQEHDSDVNPVWQTVTGSITQTETQRQALRAKHGALVGQIGALESHLAAVEGSTVAFNSLKQKVVDLENNYQLYTEKRDEAEIGDAMNANRLLNVAVAQSPTFSVLAYSPKPLLDIVLGSFTAVFFASFLVFFIEMGRNTFASGAEVTRAVHLPVLAEVPLIGGGETRSERQAEFAPVFVGMGSSHGSYERRPAQSTLIRYRKESQVS